MTRSEINRQLNSLHGQFIIYKFGGSIIRKILGASSVILGMIILLYLMVENYYDLKEAADTLENLPTLYITMSLWAVLFGILMEWNGLGKLFKREFRCNWNLLIPSVILLILALLPNFYWVKWFGIVEAFHLKLYLLPETHIVLSVLAGTMLVRSFVRK